jgi:lysozyme
MQLIVTANKLNRRSSIPESFADKTNVVGTVSKGYIFEGIEIYSRDIISVKWYKDKEGYFYWSGGVVVQSDSRPKIINGLPSNLPDNYRIGVDVSHHNAAVDWFALKNYGVSFAIIKISDGVNTPDYKAKQHSENAVALGIKIGYYHFCHPDKKSGNSVVADATAEANDALSRLANLPKPELPLTLDLEDAPPWDSHLNFNDYSLWVTTFIDKIKAAINRDCMIYSRRLYLDGKFPADHPFGKNKLWISSYPTNPDCNKVRCPKGWNDWSIWQYTETGAIGSNPQIDINISKDNSIFSDATT